MITKEASITTAVATTKGTYNKAFEWATSCMGNSNNLSVLDYGAGLGIGSRVIGRRSTVKLDTYEPHPSRWTGSDNGPDYTKSGRIPSGKYDVVLVLYVLNVVHKSERTSIVKDVISKLDKGGIAIFTVRGWSNDVDEIKNATPGPEPKSKIVDKTYEEKDVDVIQKGFDGSELEKYINNVVGNRTGVLVCDAHISSVNAVAVRKIGKRNG